MSVKKHLKAEFFRVRCTNRVKICEILSEKNVFILKIIYCGKNVLLFKRIQEGVNGKSYMFKLITWVVSGVIFFMMPISCPVAGICFVIPRAYYLIWMHARVQLLNFFMHSRVQLLGFDACSGSAP